MPMVKEEIKTYLRKMALTDVNEFTAFKEECYETLCGMDKLLEHEGFRDKIEDVHELCDYAYKVAEQIADPEEDCEKWLEETFEEVRITSLGNLVTGMYEATANLDGTPLQRSVLPTYLMRFRDIEEADLFTARDDEFHERIARLGLRTFYEDYDCNVYLGWVDDDLYWPDVYRVWFDGGMRQEAVDEEGD